MNIVTLRQSDLAQQTQDAEMPWFICIELLLYFSLACRIFGSQIGVLNIYGLSGAIILASASLTFIVIIFRSYTIPVSIFFALIISIIANIIDLYAYELFSRNMVYWLSLFLMSCIVVRNEKSLFRFISFLAFSVHLSVYLGAQRFGHESGFTRLGLADDVAGSMFANPNALAQVAALTATAMLFYGLRSRLARKSFCFVMAFSLSVIVFLTLSRTGLVMLGLGLFFFALALVTARKGWVDLLILGVLITFVLVVFTTQFESITTGYFYRLQEDSDRISYWQSAKNDMFDTMFAGQGSYAGYAANGIKPHNTFLWLHLAFGGFCAWVYVGWLAWLGFMSFRGVVLDTLNTVEKMELMAFCSMFFAVQLVSIFAPANLGFILGIAIIERYIGRTYWKTQGDFRGEQGDHLSGKLA